MQRQIPPERPFHCTAPTSIANRIYAQAMPDDDTSAANEWAGLIDGPVQ
jgi:hypothetical protein